MTADRWNSKSRFLSESENLLWNKKGLVICWFDVTSRWLVNNKTRRGVEQLIVLGASCSSPVAPEQRFTCQSNAVQAVVNTSRCVSFRWNRRPILAPNRSILRISDNAASTREIWKIWKNLQKLASGVKVSGGLRCKICANLHVKRVPHVENWKNSLIGCCLGCALEVKVVRPVAGSCAAVIVSKYLIESVAMVTSASIWIHFL